MSAFRSTRDVRFWLTSSRRGGGKVGIPRTLRDFQARRESRFDDFSCERLFHRPSRRHFRRRQDLALRRVSAQTMGTVGEAQGLIQVLMHYHLATCQGRSPAYPLNLL